MVHEEKKIQTLKKKELTTEVTKSEKCGKHSRNKLVKVILVTIFPLMIKMKRITYLQHQRPKKLYKGKFSWQVVVERGKMVVVLKRRRNPMLLNFCLEIVAIVLTAARKKKKVITNQTNRKSYIHKPKKKKVIHKPK